MKKDEMVEEIYDRDIDLFVTELDLKECSIVGACNLFTREKIIEVYNKLEG